MEHLGFQGFKESGFYYLQSRYYDPELGRFINADDAAYLGADGTPLSYNLFAYCGNNPVMGYDPTGHWDWGGVVAGLAMIAASVAAVAVFSVTAPVLITSAAIMATGVMTTYAAATDSALVLDVSYSSQIMHDTYAKVGISVIVDFESDGAYLYPHVGVGKGYSNGFSYSTGMVENFDEPMDYAEWFIDTNV